ncbi:hypothetical protein VNO77_27239 [Canavalia gladiata]|uniref:Uncharacterized protein n=1 Tax=Canavalia gladiata TaxID=3824 RepID=A0AAN9QAB8_CANGL
MAICTQLDGHTRSICTTGSATAQFQGVCILTPETRKNLMRSATKSVHDGIVGSIKADFSDNHESCWVKYCERRRQLARPHSCSAYPWDSWHILLWQLRSHWDPNFLWLIRVMGFLSEVFLQLDSSNISDQSSQFKVGMGFNSKSAPYSPQIVIQVVGNKDTVGSSPARHSFNLKLLAHVRWALGNLPFGPYWLSHHSAKPNPELG